MKFCSHCGTRMEDKAAFCPNCGAPQTRQTAQGGYNTNEYQQPQYQQPQYQQPQTQYAQYQPYPTGGLMALSIITALFCLIPGIVAINKTRSINNCATYEEQQQMIRSVKIWCAVGIAIGVLAIIGRMAQ